MCLGNETPYARGMLGLRGEGEAREGEEGKEAKGKGKEGFPHETPNARGMLGLRSGSCPAC